MGTAKERNKVWTYCTRTFQSRSVILRDCASGWHLVGVSCFTCMSLCLSAAYIWACLSFWCTGVALWCGRAVVSRCGAVALRRSLYALLLVSSKFGWVAFLLWLHDGMVRNDCFLYYRAGWSFDLQLKTWYRSLVISHRGAVAQWRWVSPGRAGVPLARVALSHCDAVVSSVCPFSCALTLPGFCVRVFVALLFFFPNCSCFWFLLCALPTRPTASCKALN